MVVVMGQTGQRFAAYLRIQFNREKAKFDAQNNKPADLEKGQKLVKYPEAEFARYLNLNVKTINRWINADSIENIAIENFLALLRVFGQEMIDYLEGEGD